MSYIHNAIKKAKGLPVIIATKPGVKSRVREFKDESGLTVLTNTAKGYSPVTGLLMKLVNKEQASKEEFSDTDLSGYATICTCKKCKSDIRTTAELAAEFDGLEITCVECGTVNEALYFSELSSDILDNVDSESDDEMEDVEDTEIKKEEETEEDKESDKKETEETESEEDMSESEDIDDNEMEDDDAEETEETDEDEDEEDKEPEEEIEEELSEAKVEVITHAKLDKTQDLRLMATDQSLSRVETFLGNTHIGAFIQEKASNKNAYSKPDVLRALAINNIFKLLDSSSSESTIIEATDNLKSVGFDSTKITVDLPTLQTPSVNQEEINKEISERVETEIAAFKSAIEISMVGVNKGTISGKSFFTELSKLLTRHGVKAPSQTAKKFVESVSGEFISSVISSAKEIASNSPEYARGLSRAIEKAAYAVSDESIDETIESLNSSIFTPPLKKEKSIETASLNKVVAKPDYSSYFSGLGRKSVN
jgi:hypothetical protein